MLKQPTANFRFSLPVMAFLATAALVAAIPALSQASTSPTVATHQPEPTEKGGSVEKSTATEGKENSDSDCGPTDDRDQPFDSTILAKVTGLIDSNRLKPGKEFIVKVVNEFQYPGCVLLQNSVLYGHITAVNSSKDPGGPQLSLAFDHGDCENGTKKELKLKLIGLIAPPDQYVGLHTVMPSELSAGGRNGGRSISDSTVNMGFFLEDWNLNQGRSPHIVHPGMVAGIPKMKLEPQGGPGCSAHITSSEHSIHLGIGAGLILTMQIAPKS